MSKRLFEQPEVTLTTADISGDVHGLELMVGRRAPVDVTGLSDTWDSFLVPNIRNWSVRLNYFNNLAGTSDESGAINKVLKSVLDSTGSSGVAFTLRATTNARSAGNPEWTGSVQIDGDFPLTAGDVAEADRGTVTLKGLGTLTFNTSTS